MKRSTIFSKVILLFALCGLFITGCKSKQMLVSAPPAVITPVIEEKIAAPALIFPVKSRPALDAIAKKRYAALLHVPESDLRNDYLYVFIDEWMGVPHLTAGMSKLGVDCSGFTNILEWEVFNTLVPRTTRLLAGMAKPVAQNELQEGDLVFFDLNGQQLSHVGVYLHNNKFVHASSSKGVVISDLKEPYYSKSFSGSGSVRIRG